jgi:hypothetical protein
MSNDGTEHPADLLRRAILQSAAGVALSHMAAEVVGAAVPSGAAPGKAGDFDFLAGHWKIAHRQLKGSGKEWDTFTGEATCWSILNGAGSIEELRIPARNFSGLGIRLLEVKSRTWMDYWVSARDCELSTPGMAGAFVDGVGSFVADDKDGDHPIKVRGVWDRITPASCRWHQAVSRDGGRTWQENWFMDWTKA